MKNGAFYYKVIFYGLTAMILLTPSIVRAQTTSLSQLTAQGVAIYGWHDGVPTLLYQQNQIHVFPVASITKLVTAKAVETLYPENAMFTMSVEAMTDTLEDNQGIAPGMVFSRDDLLQALLVSSSNGAAKQFAESASPDAFLDTMNQFLHSNGYTATNFTNPTGLDPITNTIMPNRLTARSVSYFLSDIYRNDPLLTSILEEKSATITDQKSGTVISLKSSDGLNGDPLYNQDIILSKTGTTSLAGQNLAFITHDGGTYDYITVVLLHSKDRDTDGKIVLDWLSQMGK